MSINIPTVQDNIDQAQSFLESNMGQESAINDKSFILVMSRLQGMMKSSLYLFSAEQIKTVLALTAIGDDLDVIGNEYGVNRKPSATTVHVIEVLGVEGTAVPITSTWNASSNGMRYFQNLEYTVGAGGSVQANVEAQFPGVNGNLRVDSVMTIGSNTNEDIVPDAIVVDTLELGSDKETDDEYRIRVLDELRTVGGGSNSADIRTWGQLPPNVLRIYPYTGDLRDPNAIVITTPGERTVFVESTISYNSDGIADQTLLDLVRTSITTDPDTGRSNQSLGSVDSLLYIQSIVRTEITLTLYGLVVDPSKEFECKSDISTAVDEFLRDFSTYVDGLDPQGFRNNVITSVSVADVVQDVVSSYGGSVSRITTSLEDQVGPFDSYILNPGEKAKGIVSYGG